MFREINQIAGPAGIFVCENVHNNSPILFSGEMRHAADMSALFESSPERK